MSIIEDLKDYKPFNEFESEDIKSLKQLLSAFGDFAYSRDCLPGHMATVAWVVNPQRTKVLMGYHNIYKKFTWFGGHADGEKDLLENAKKELQEETGISNFKVLNNGKPIDYVALEVLSHIKRGKAVSNHLHYSPAYLFEVSEQETFRIAEGENSAIRWINNEDVLKSDPNATAFPIYERILKKVQHLPK